MLKTLREAVERRMPRPGNRQVLIGGHASRGKSGEINKKRQGASPTTLPLGAQEGNFARMPVEPTKQRSLRQLYRELRRAYEPITRRTLPQAWRDLLSAIRAQEQKLPKTPTAETRNSRGSEKPDCS